LIGIFVAEILLISQHSISEIVEKTGPSEHSGVAEGRLE